MRNALPMILALGGLVGGICLARGFYEPYMLRVNTHSVTVKNLPDALAGKKILHLSDLHGSSFGKNNERLIRLTLEQKPDYIFATGDFISRSRGAYKGFLDFLDGISGLCPVYLSLGNHECWIKKQSPRLFKTFMSEVESRGVIILNDNFVELPESSGVYIYGLSPERDEGYETVEMNSAYITQKLGVAPKEGMVVLLAHEPQFFNAYAKWGADFILSGHFHGGIIRLPLLGGLVSPDSGILPARDAGIYYDNDSVQCVSRGLGCSHINFRFCNVPEVVSITLQKENRL